MKKRLSALFLALAMVLSVTACSKTEEQPTTSPSTQPSAPVESTTPTPAAGKFTPGTYTGEG